MNADELITLLSVTAAAFCFNAVGFSRLWVCGAVGLALPVAQAIPVALFTAIAGNDLIFVLCRSAAFRRVMAKPLAKIERVYSKVHIDAVGIAGVIMARQIPLPSLAVTCLLANTKVSHRDYIVGNLVGYAPSTVLAVLATGSAAKFLPPNVTVISACAMAVAAGVFCVVKLRREKARLASVSVTYENSDN